MLVIRQEQMDALIKGSNEEFVEFLVGHVKERNPNLEDQYDDETLRRMVKIGIERAESRDFTRAEDITIYVSLMFKFAPNFDEQSDIKAVFEDANIPPEERFDKLESPVFPKKAWREARKNYEKNAWGLESAEDNPS